MKLSTLTAVSPIDGRYSSKTSCLSNFFSEFALIKYRLHIEIEWIQYLAGIEELYELPPFSEEDNEYLASLVEKYSEESARSIKSLESKTNHDVKAVEYYIREKMSQRQTLSKHVEFVHFACTSEDINNLSYALMLKDGITTVILPKLNDLTGILTNLAESFADCPMLSRTHGQAASGTTMGKEIANTAARLLRQKSQLDDFRYLGKINGAVGNYNAHLAAYPDLSWIEISEAFVSRLGLEWNSYTTQIEPHDFMAELFDILSRINTILIDFNRDVWGYISLGYFTQATKKDEIGSSTMPHKINPIDFENAEGNLGLANAIFNHFSSKLPISRWQRDLSDSTVLRSIGVGFGYTLIALESCSKGLSKLRINENNILVDLSDKWEILAEPIQTVMRKYGIKNSYELLKDFSRGQSISKKVLHEFINSLELPEEVKQELLSLTPDAYFGNADFQARSLKKLG